MRFVPSNLKDCKMGYEGGLIQDEPVNVTGTVHETTH